jgi:1,4-alpha-glucan branching enzyme
MMIAEESTAWPLVTRPTYTGGLGFSHKWNMGWMNDMLRYVEIGSVHRKWHHNLVTFSLMYAFSENYILPLSHDEVVHGKKSLLDKMPGDYWQKFANLRLLYGYLMAHPGKKLLFMGGEFGQFNEWRDYCSLDWHLLDYPMHHRLQQYVRSLAFFYRGEKALWEQDFHWRGFQWIDPQDNQQSIITFMRRGKSEADVLLVVCNFTPVVHANYRIGVPELAGYREVLNSDGKAFGGSGQENPYLLMAEGMPWHNQPFSLELTLPPLAVIMLKKCT